MTTKSYSEKLKDPRWQKKRLEILERDEWACQVCGDDKSTLNVHHKKYLRKKEPWDYPSDLLVTLCVDCHEKEKEFLEAYLSDLCEMLKETFLSADIADLARGFSQIKIIQHHEVDSTVIGWALQNEDAMRALHNLYFKHLGDKV